MTEATLKENEYHPIAEGALKWFGRYKRDNKESYIIMRESIASSAMSGNRTAEILNSTLERLDKKMPVSDRYLLGLCWFLREYEND